MGESRVVAVIPMRPFPKPRMTIGDRRRKGKKLRPAVERYWANAEELKLRISSMKVELGFTLSIIFIFKMPDSWGPKKRERKLWTYHDEKPDLSNVIKAYEDALYKDDKEIHTYKNIHKLWGNENLIVVREEKEIPPFEVCNSEKVAKWKMQQKIQKEIQKK